jgi:hypothetical protein
MIAGDWASRDGYEGGAFLFDLNTHSFQTIDAPPGVLFVTAINNAGLVTIIKDYTSYLYCPHKRSCPIHSSSGREISDKWIPALPGGIRSLICAHKCLGRRRAQWRAIR